MTSPPAYTATPTLFGERITGTDDDLSTRNGQLRYLMRELGCSRHEAQDLIRAYELDERDRLADLRAHREAVSAGGFDDARDVAEATFQCFVARVRKLRASDPRRDGWRQR